MTNGKAAKPADYNHRRVAAYFKSPEQARAFRAMCSLKGKSASEVLAELGERELTRHEKKATK